LDNRFRGGDTVQNTVGVLGFDFSLYRIQPTGPADYTEVNPRTLAPEPVGGSLRVAAMNTLNFFLTLDTTASDTGPGPCGGNQNLDCRGADADQPLEFTRQRDKLLAALAGLNADIIGLNELENTPGVDPLGDPTNGVVAGLNAMPGVGPYAYIDTGVIGTDAIRVGLIYKPSKVAPVGAFQILDSTDDPRFIDTKSRPALAQTFEELATGARFTVVVNHLKSKGSACTDLIPPDPDAGDGQGNCNGTRTLAAQALVDWLATDPTGSGDPDFLIMGDLNSYAQEDPIDAIKAGADDAAGTGDDYTNLIAQYQGTYAYSYVFDGQSGYLDHALANSSLAAQVAGAADWHINADEPDLLDYDTTFKPPAQEAIYEPNGYRSSDHDPVIIGLSLVPQCNGKNATVYVDRNGMIVGGPFDGHTYHGVLTGTNFDDVIVGTGDSEVIFARNGNDTVCAVGGRDSVFGDDGDDTIFGGSGNDLLFGGAGNDTIDGEAGFDLVEGGSGNDTLASGDSNDLILGGPGNDSLDGGGGKDICNGGSGTDSSANCETKISIP
jgi:predicted extracellular nuclease